MRERTSDKLFACRGEKEKGEGRGERERERDDSKVCIGKGKRVVYIIESKLRGKTVKSSHCSFLPDIIAKFNPAQPELGIAQWCTFWVCMYLNFWVCKSVLYFVILGVQVVKWVSNCVQQVVR